MFSAIGRFSVRFRWLIIIIWIVAVPVTMKTLPSLSSVASTNNAKFLPSSSASVQASNLAQPLLGKGTTTTAEIIAATKSGPLTSADNAAITRLAVAVKKVRGISLVAAQQPSTDREAQQVLVGTNINVIDAQQVGTLATPIRDVFQKIDAPSNLTLHLTGGFATSADAATQSTNSVNKIQLFSILFIIVVLLIVFRSALAPVVTLIPVIMTVSLASSIVAEAATRNWITMSSIVQMLLAVVMLGAGTDYGLFLVFRVREELRAGSSAKEAVVQAMERVGQSIAFSAITVIGALLSLLFASFGLYRGMGPAMAIGIALLLLSALTLLPALLSLFGNALFWPLKAERSKLQTSTWGSIADKAIKRPVLVIIVGVILLGALATGIAGYKTSGFGVSGAPSNSDSSIGARVVVAHYPDSTASTQDIVMRFASPVNSNPVILKQAQADLLGSGLFRSVAGPIAPDGSITPGFVSANGRTVQFVAPLKTGISGSVAAVATIPAVRASLTHVAHEVGAQASGDVSEEAAVYDTNSAATHDLKVIIPIVLVVILVLLAIMLRSLIAPLYLIATVGLSYVATLGFAMYAFVHSGAQSGLFFALAFLIFIFCMALGEDYNILLMSRVREEARGNVSLREAVTRAVGLTGGTITSAGLILAGTFSVLGLAVNQYQVREVGFSIAFGILLDTFFVRTLLVPSIAVLLGRWNWWPSQLWQRQNARAKVK